MSHIERARERGLAPGDIIGERFKVVRALASGGVGHVYEAVNVWTKRRVALKFLRPEFADDEELTQRFQLEAEAGTRVAHPNVVEVIDMGRDRETGALYLVQEFLEGTDLQRLLRERGYLSLDEAMRHLAPVMLALQVAHDRGVIHRDLKPENLFLTRDAEGEIVPKIIDFGLARVRDSLRITTRDTVRGTPCYMSPEQCRGEPVIDARSDVWSMGVIWYEALSGKVPFDGPNAQDIFRAVLREEPEALSALVPDLPVDIASAVHRALSREPERRFATMADFLAALTHALDASRVTTLTPAIVHTKPAPAQPSRRLPWVVTALVSALAGLAVLLAWRQKQAPARQPTVTLVRALCVPIEAIASRPTPPSAPTPAPLASPPTDPAPAVIAPPEAHAGVGPQRPARAHRRHRRSPR